MVKTVIWMSFCHRLHLFETVNARYQRCDMFPFWDMFQRERAQNQKVSCHVECIVSMVKKEK